MNCYYNPSLFNIYNKNNFNCYSMSNKCDKNNVFKNEVPVNSDIGYLELYVFKNRGQEPVKDALVTIYARQGEVNAVPVKQVLTEVNPITIELPVAYPSATLIRGPEYYFSTYNMSIEAQGFYSILVLNIRMFPGITTNFSYNLNEALPGTPGRQETIHIPPHPRDTINS